MEENVDKTKAKKVKKAAKGAKKVIKNEVQIQELTSDLQRIQAEFVNYKQRVQDERQQLSQFAKSDVVKDLLPVVDDLERALGHTPDELKEDKWAQGVQKVYDRLQKQLQKLGVEKINALNQPFDPELHEAVQVEGEGDVETVSEVLQNGYTFNSAVIRHATVRVKNS